MELIYFLIVLLLVQFLTSTLHTKVVIPKLHKELVIARGIAIALFLVSFTGNELFSRWIWHIYITGFFAYIYQKEEFVESRSMLFSVAPIVGIGILWNLFSLLFPSTFEEYDGFYGTFKFIGLAWVVAIWFQNRKQIKQLESERKLRMAEEENYRLAQVRKVELETLVAERTKEITMQKEELELTLENLHTTQAQLVQSEKMASLGELTAGIAHEIQNPLNFVNNFAEVNTELIQELKEEQQREQPDLDLIEEIFRDLADNMTKMVHHGKRADSIVKGMLQHSRLGAGERELRDINALADEYMRLAYHGLRAKNKSFNAALEKNFDREELVCLITPQDFGRVFLNIFNNAFYAIMERKKREGESYYPSVWLSTFQADGQVEIRITD
jgi:signal transduction histidine kinase